MTEERRTDMPPLTGENDFDCGRSVRHRAWSPAPPTFDPLQCFAERNPLTRWVYGP